MASNIILPQEGKRNILITAALPYVNSVPHLGNVIGCVLSADVYARYCRLRGYNALYIGGTDEYGTATETKAIQEKTTPRAICDKYYQLHAEIYEWFNISFDKFGRTSTNEQTKITQDIFNKLHTNGYTLQKVEKQLYCIHKDCQRFLADRYVEGICPHCAFPDARGDQCDKCGTLIDPTKLSNPRCKICNTTPEVRSSNHIYLDLPKLYEPLKEWSETAMEKGAWTENSKQVTRGWIKPGHLEPRSITRDLKWGTPVPLEGFADKVFYVWFDACIGYASITATYTSEWERWWKNPDQVQLYQFMGKDNIPFHTVIFPASLLGTGENYTKVHHLSTTEYLTYEGEKFAKGRGIGVFADQAKSTGISSELWRYYLLANRPETADSNFSWTDFASRVNNELLSGVGNFVSRVINFAYKQFDHKVPECGVLKDADNSTIKQAEDVVAKYIDCLENVKLRDGLKEVITFANLGNSYLQDNKPWTLMKSDIARAKAITFVGICLTKTLATLIEPYMPTLSQKILNQLNSPIGQLTGKLDSLPSGHTLGEPSPLITSIDPVKMADLSQRFGGKPIELLFPAELRVGKITEVQPHQDEELYVFQVSLEAQQQRTVVARLRKAFPNKQDLVDKHVLVLCNLKPWLVQGVKSQATVLVAEDEEKVEVLAAPEGVPLGSLVLPEGHSLQESQQKFTIPFFHKLNLLIKDGTAIYGNARLVVNEKPVTSGTVQQAKIK